MPKWAIALNLVTPTGAQRSGGTCSAPFLQTTLSNSVHPAPPMPRWATALNFVIPTAAQRSVGPAVRLSPKQLLWIPLLHQRLVPNPPIMLRIKQCISQQAIARKQLLLATLGSRNVTSVDNASDIEPMTFVAFYLLDGEQGLIRMLN
jgi:hypothetical protein